MIGATYYKEMAMALPGQVSDVSRYNIDGACVLTDQAPLEAGVAVAVDRVSAEGHKEVKIVSAGSKPYGVAIRSHFATENRNGRAVYMPNDGVNVMTVGRVWMEANSDFPPGFGAQVYIEPATGKARYDSQNGAVTASGWTFAGGKTKFGDIVLVEVQLHQL